MCMPEREAQLKAWILGGLDGDSVAHAAVDFNNLCHKRYYAMQQ